MRVGTPEGEAEGTPFRCPFCQLECTALAPPLYAVLHELPPCPTFLQLEPHEFLAAVNHMKRREN